MHKFLRAIGFSKLNKEKLNRILKIASEVPDVVESAVDIEGNQFVEHRLLVNDDCSLVLCGSYDENDSFIMDYYYPSFIGESFSSQADIDIIQQSDKQNYFYIMCDEVRIGVNLICLLQNTADYLKNQSNDFYENKMVKLAGLSIEGKIILPIYESEKTKEKIKKKQEMRNNLVEAAKEGNEEALENLTLQEIDNYSKISRRIHGQDILTIVSSYFMPYGIENDKYEILGEILEVNVLTNYVTMEEVYKLSIIVNDIIIDVCINKDDLFGEPMVGRRFKGNIWLQGTVIF